MACCPKCQSTIPAFRTLVDRTEYLNLNPGGSAGLLRIYKCPGCGEHLRLTFASRIALPLGLIGIGVGMLVGVTDWLLNPVLNLWMVLILALMAMVPMYGLWWHLVARFQLVDVILTRNESTRSTR